jgi:hypothetical protein
MPHSIHRYFAATITSFSLLVCSTIWAQNPSFNGATGFGGTFSPTTVDPMPAAGWLSNASIYHVTTTADTSDANGKPVQGTLRGAFYDYTNPTSIKQLKSNQIVVFDVGGVFDISAASLDIKQQNNIYIAGQTAPSPVIVYGNTTQITHSNDVTKSNNNVILRYMTFRKGSGNGDDALDFAGGGDAANGALATNMIVDHVSTSWSEDEDLSLDNANSLVTVQNSIIADSLTTGHAYGSLIRARTNTSVTYADNLYANNKSRNPRPGSYNGQTTNFDFRNTVIYNWSDRAGYTGGASDGGATENVNLNYVGNYAIAGPSTPVGAKSQTAFTLDNSGDPVNLHVYQSNNAIDSDRGVNPGGVPNGSDTGWAMFAAYNGTTTSTFPAASQWTNPIGSASNTGAPANTTTAPNMPTQTAADAYNQLILGDGHGYVGNSWWARDPIDARIISNVVNNTNPPSGVASNTPNAAELAAMLATPTATRAASWDTDHDGMPDLWEKAMGLNPNSATDATQDVTGSGYVNVQKYLDDVGAFPAPAAITFTGASGGNFANITNWRVGSIDSAGVNWQPTQYDEAQINAGTVVQNKVGQHANVLKIATGASDTATLNISGGWLQVENQLVIGGTDTSVGAVNLSGGDLTAPILSKGAGSNFSFTGGTLHAGIVAFDLVNQGGTLAPGYRTNAVNIGSVVTLAGATPFTSLGPVALSSIGATHVMGNLTLQSGAVQLELASTSSYDQVAVDGNLTFGGALQVSLLNSFAPQAGNQFALFDWSNASGNFSSISLPNLSGSLAWSTLQLYSSGILSVVNSTALPGDFNRDGHVNAGDILAMQNALADPSAFQQANSGLSAGDLLALEDINGDGSFTPADLQAFLMDLKSGGGSTDVVPEPASILLAAAGMCGLLVSRRAAARKAKS